MSLSLSVSNRGLVIHGHGMFPPPPPGKSVLNMTSMSTFPWKKLMKLKKRTESHCCAKISWEKTGAAGCLASWNGIMMNLELWNFGQFPSIIKDDSYIEVEKIPES